MHNQERSSSQKAVSIRPANRAPLTMKPRGSAALLGDRKVNGSGLGKSLLDTLNQHLPAGSHTRKRFDELCINCDPKVLLSMGMLLSFTARYAVQGRVRKRSKRAMPRSIYEMVGTSASELKQLPDDLEALASRIERTKNFLSTFMSARIIDNEQVQSEDRVRTQHKAGLFQHLPLMLRTYAADIRTAFEWVNPRLGPKRYDNLRGSVTDLLQYVEVCTGSPHYEHVADIMAYLFHSFALPDSDPNLEPPPLLSSPDALREHYLRAKKQGMLGDVIPRAVASCKAKAAEAGKF